MELVFDTNVLVSGLLHPTRPIARIAVTIARGRLVPIYDRRILDEYVEVLERPYLARKFIEGEATGLLASIRLARHRGGPCSAMRGRSAG